MAVSKGEDRGEPIALHRPIAQRPVLAYSLLRFVTAWVPNTRFRFGWCVSPGVAEYYAWVSISGNPTEALALCEKVSDAGGCKKPSRDASISISEGMQDRDVR